MIPELLTHVTEEPRQPSIVRNGTLAEALTSAVVVVLGFRLHHGQAHRCLTERLHHVERLVRRGIGQRILVSGGGGEAEYMSAFLRRRLGNVIDILLERKSNTTEENAMCACRLLNELRPRPRYAILVTHRTHMPRALASFLEACPTIDFLVSVV